VSLRNVAVLQAAAPVEVYHVGNSLTYHMISGDRFKIEAANRGINIDYGYHIRCGSGLRDIVTFPTDTCVVPNAFGTFAQALPNNHWDNVTLQTYGDSLSDAKTIIGQMITTTRSRPDNANTQFYIYEDYPQSLAGEDYSHAWPQPYDGTRRRTWTRDYSNLLMTSLRKQYPDPTHQPILIPSGEVLYQLDQLAQAGQLPGVGGIEEWYGDEFHLNTFGSFTTETTMFAVMFKQNPVGLPGPDGMSPELTQRVEETIWNVVSSNKFTNVSSVPEPSALGLFAIGAISLLRRRRRLS
jgi:hypothetical protein